jgi:hypothetical protein
MSPIWPASSPYIAAVGGIYKQGSSLYGDSISSGGFSNYYPMPAYQRNLVTKYLANPNPACLLLQRYWPHHARHRCLLRERHHRHWR